MSPTPPLAPRSLLVLGGTSWLGGAVARHAVATGHAVTCLARGASGEVPAGAELVVGDRDDPATAYAAVADRDWDAVVDVARQPLHVRGAVDALGGRVVHWVFVSTCNVYADDGTPGADESADLRDPWTGEGLAPDEEYGPAKVACEQAVLAAHPDALVARSGLIVGHGDPSDRFGYWPARFARATPGERVLLAPSGQALQIVDVEDFAAWLVQCAVTGTGGVVNAMGPMHTLADLYTACAAAVGHQVTGVEVSDAWLQEHEVTPWMGEDSLSLWLPQPEYAGFMARDRSAAGRIGLSHRPLLESVRAALAWERERGLHRPRRSGLTPAAEAALLARTRR